MTKKNDDIPLILKRNLWESLFEIMKLGADSRTILQLLKQQFNVKIKRGSIRQERFTPTSNETVIECFNYKRGRCKKFTWLNIYDIGIDCNMITCCNRKINTGESFPYCEGCIYNIDGCKNDLICTSASRYQPKRRDREFNRKDTRDNDRSEMIEL